MPPLLNQAARNGIIVAILFLGFFFLGNFGTFGFLLSLICGFVGLGYVVFSQVSAQHVQKAETGSGLSFSILASYGVSISFFASLLAGLTIYIVLKFLWPDYIVDRLHEASQILSQAPEYADMYSMLNEILTKGPVPTAADMMASVMVVMMVTSIVISLIGAIVAKFGVARGISQTR